MAWRLAICPTRRSPLAVKPSHAASALSSEPCLFFSHALNLAYAETALEARKPEAAKSQISQYLVYQPENPRAFYNWGLALQNMQRVAAAERAYQAGLKQHPEQLDLMYALCILYIQQNQMNQARPLAERLNELAARLAEFPNVKDIDDGYSPGKPQLDFRLKEEGRSLGLTSREVARQVRCVWSRMPRSC